MKPENGIYYPEIDGLRGIAVLLVVLYHLGFSWVPGGYIGVDVFFVISGFLITGIIISDVNKNKFTFRRFYYKRFLRLFFTFVFVLYFSFFMAYGLMSDELFEKFSESLLYAVFGLSNFYFWSEVDYFHLQAHFRPLLHIWSLAVEEQFYLIWPLIIFLLIRFLSERQLIFFIFLIGAVSFLLGQNYLPVSKEMTFYWMPFRIFEFALGALCAGRIHCSRQNWKNEVLVIAGLALMVFSAMHFDSKTNFPGANALLPCLAVILILFGREAQFSGWLALRNKAIVRIGLISYSLYLIHWPLIVFYFLWSYQETSVSEKLLLLSIAIIFSEIIYRLVERPLQNNFGKHTIPFQIVSSFVVIFILIVLSLSVLSNDGWAWRTSNTYTSTKDAGTSCREYRGNQKFLRCVVGDERPGNADILLLGDSHAYQLTDGLDYFGRKNNLKIDVVVFWGCLQMVGVYSVSGDARDKGCEKHHQSWLSQIARYKYVVLANRWAYYYAPKQYGSRVIEGSYLVEYGREYRLNKAHSKALFQRYLPITIAKIHDSGVKVIVVSQLPILFNGIRGCGNITPFDSLLSRNHEEICNHGADYVEAIKRIDYADIEINELSSDSMLALFPSKVFCNDVDQICITTNRDKLLYANSSHLSSEGSIFFIKSVEEQMAQFIAN